MNSLITSAIARVSQADAEDPTNTIEPRLELDSHANMVLLGADSFIFDTVYGRTCSVTPFDPTLGRKQEIPVVDGAVAYDCPYSNRTVILIFKNALYVPHLDHHLVPPFIMREAGVIVNDVPKIHSSDPTVDDHSLYLPNHDLRMPLQLNGIFSFIHVRKPSPEEIIECDKILMTPDGDSWNPYSTHYADNEEAMLDWEGNIMDERYLKRRKVIEQELDSTDIVYDISSLSVADYEAMVDKVICSELDATTDTTIESGAQCDVEDLATMLKQKAAISSIAVSLGATAVSDEADDLFEFDFDFDDPITFDLNQFHNDDGGISSSDDDAIISSAIADRPKKLDANFLSKIWHIKNDEAVGVLDQTTQLCRHGADNSLSKQYSTNDRMLRYKRINSVFYTDTFFVTSKGKSKRGNTCAQMFVSDKGYVAIYPMKSKKQFLDSLKLFCKEIGVPMTLVCDPSGEQTKLDVKTFCHKVGTTLRILQETTQWANRAELYIGLFKESIRQDLRRSNSPMVLWDYCAERRARIHNVTPKPLFQLQGSNPHTATFGTQGDISNICVFDWYDWCYFREERPQFPFQKEVLGRVLGPIKNEANEMAQAVLKANGQVVPRRTCRPLNTAELHSHVEKQKRATFDNSIRELLGDSITISEPIKQEDCDSLADLLGDEDEPAIIPEEDPVDASGKAIFEQPCTDLLINATVNLPQGKNMTSAKVLQRSKDVDGNTIGTYDTNPMLNTTVYDVQFPDGTIREYGANVIAQNMYAQVDSHGYSHNLLSSIVDHARDNTAVDKENKYVTTRSGQRRLRKTTHGWKFLVRWKNGEEQWIPLRILKESNPVEVAEYAKSRNIHDEAAFCWWVPYILRKRDAIIASVNARVKKATHKYGIEVPTSIDHAKKLDELNDNTYWQDAIAKEMRNVGIAFDIQELGVKPPPGWTKSSGHLVFDVKTDFTRKARWVKDGHRTADPEQSTFAGVVSRESVRIALTYAALNDVDVWSADIMNAYLQAPSSEKHYVICGPEFGLEHVGKVALIKRALYGGKSSGADFWRHLRSCMHHLGFEPCKADGEIWMRPALKDSGEEYWEYVLLYVDDALCVSTRGKEVLEDEIGKYFVMKPGSVKPPDIYLGNKVSKVQMENGKHAWAFSSSQYVQNAVKNVEGYLKKKGKSLPSKASAPMKNDYRPELDVSPELQPQEAAHYQSLIGILRWIVELGRADITAESSLMASCLALPRQGHLENVYHIFAYLKAKHNAEMVFDPSLPDIDESKFEREDWSSSVYTDAKEILPPNAPKPRGLGFVIRAFVDSDHAGSEVTRRSRTGFMVFLNNAPIYWTSKKQGSIMTSSFGSEFIAMKECCEYLRGLRYKLRMMGIAVDLPSFIYGDNQSVLVNSSIPTSVLKKKSSSIAYHFVREGTAADEWRMTYVSTHDNVADILTKPLKGGEKRTRFVRMFLHHI